MLAMARLLALLGLTLLAAAALLWLLARLGAPQVPGTVLVRRPGFTLFAPVGLWILASVVLTIVLNLVMRLFR